MVHRRGDALFLVSEKCFGFYQRLCYLWRAYNIWPLLRWSTSFCSPIGLRNLTKKSCWILPKYLFCMESSQSPGFRLYSAHVVMGLHFEPFLCIGVHNHLLWCCLRFLSAVGDLHLWPSGVLGWEFLSLYQSLHLVLVCSFAGLKNFDLFFVVKLFLVEKFCIYLWDTISILIHKQCVVINQ